MRRPRRLAAAALVVAVLVLAFMVGCALSGRDPGSSSGESKVAGIELVHSPGPGVSWSPDGRLLAYLAPRGIELRRPDGSEARKIAAPPPFHVGFGNLVPVGFTAGSQNLLYVTEAGPERGRGFWATEVRRKGGGVSQTALDTDLAFPTFSPRGWPLVYATGPYEWTPNRTRTGPASSLRIISGPGAKPRTLLKVAGIPEEPLVSGGSVLFKQRRGSHTELWTVGLDGSDPHRLASAYLLRHFRRSPQGNDIALTETSRRHVGAHLYLLPGGSGRPVQIGGAEVLEGPTWSPDGRWLVFSTPQGEIRRVHPDGKGEATIADFEGDEVRSLLFSPDGRQLVYTAHPHPTESTYETG